MNFKNIKKFAYISLIGTMQLFICQSALAGQSNTENVLNDDKYTTEFICKRLGDINAIIENRKNFGVNGEWSDECLEHFLRPEMTVQIKLSRTSGRFYEIKDDTCQQKNNFWKKSYRSKKNTNQNPYK